MSECCVIGLFCCKFQVECCAPAQRQSTAEASPPGPKVDPEEPVPNESGPPQEINTQPAPKDEVIKEPSDEGALSSSTVTMLDLPTIPMRVYNPNDASTFPELQGDPYTSGVSSREIFGQYQGPEKVPMLVNTQVSPISQPQGYSGLPTFPEPRYDQNSRSVPQGGFGEYQGAGSTLRRANTQLSQAQRHGDLLTLPSSRIELYPPSVSPLVPGGLTIVPEPEDGPYAPNISPQVIFGPRHGTTGGRRNTLPNIRLGTSQSPRNNDPPTA